MNTVTDKPKLIDFTVIRFTLKNNAESSVGQGVTAYKLHLQEGKNEEDGKVVGKYNTVTPLA